MVECAVRNCKDVGEYENIVKDSLTNQEYVVYLCYEHDAEFECYHYPKEE